MKKLLLIALFLANGLYANTLSLQESIDKTLLNHPDIKSFMINIQQAKQNSDIAFSDYLPQINAQAQYDFLQTNILPSNGTSTGNGWSAGVSIKQKVWDFSKTSSNIKASKVDEEISYLSLQDAKLLLIYKVKSLYSFLVVQREAIAVRQKDLETKKAYYSQALALVKQGLKTDADASRFLSSVYIAEDNLAISKASYEKTKTSLSLYMGEEIKKDTVLDDGVIKKEYHLNTNTEKEILEHNYQIKINTHNIDKNRLLYKSAKASHYGSLDALASYNHIDSLNSYDNKLVGLTLTMPFYSGGRISAQVQKAQLAIYLAQEQKASQILSLKEEISTLIIDIQRYNKTIESKQAGLNSANKTKKVLEARYKEGLSTYIEVLDATSSVLSANLGLIEAYYYKSIAINKIEYLKGDLS